MDRKKRGKKQVFCLFWAVFAILIIFIFLYGSTWLTTGFYILIKSAQAQFNPDQYGNVHGFVMTDTFGLISLNCHNDFDNDGQRKESESQCGNGQYGVTISANDLSLMGFAWSEGAGEICFGASCGPDASPGPPLGEGSVARAAVNENGQVTGWARIKNLAASGGGWISLRGATAEGINFGAQIDFDSGRWSGQGWNRQVDKTGAGWLDFDYATTSFRPVFECENEGETEICGEDAGECVPGIKTCQHQDGHLVWGPCGGEYYNSGSVFEICGDGKDNDCNGVTDEGCSGSGGGGGGEGWNFNVTPPWGIYEPLCCFGGSSTVNGACPQPSYPVFCDDTSKELVGSRLHTFIIDVSAEPIFAGREVSCFINTGQSPGMTLPKNLGTDGKVRLVYTIKPTDNISQTQWLTQCTLDFLSQTVQWPIYVHQNTWTDSGDGNDLAKALACWQGQKEPGKNYYAYFHNLARCDFEGDYVFVRSMARGAPLERDCQDKIDNDNNGFTDCADRWCQGITNRCD